MSDEEDHHQTFEAVSLLAVLHALSINLVYRSVRAPRRPSPCNVLLCAKTVTSSLKVPVLCLILRHANRFSQAALARSLTCPPPRLESTVTPRSILLLLMYVFPQLLWSLVSNFHPDFYRKEVGGYLALVTFRFDE